ncbi:MAG: ABC transporter permease [Flavobacteriaceae bacterium]|nr:ABC transporter permease [Flavobacteriaceae bacterium]
MNKILLITQREYLSRVKKRSFIVMTILGPILIALFYGVVIFFAINNTFGSKQKVVVVKDESGFCQQGLVSNKIIQYINSTESIDANKKLVHNGDIDALLIIPKVDSVYGLHDVELISKTQPGIATVTNIQHTLESIVEDIKIKQLGIDKESVEKTKTSLNVRTVKITAKGDEEGSSAVTSIAGFIGALLIYMFIFIYGVQVMRGVIEEKTNRIVEVIVSSVRPFQLMMGKIIGIALVGLTQFVIWVLLTAVFMVVTPTIISSFSGSSPQETSKAMKDQQMPMGGGSHQMTQMLEDEDNLDVNGMLEKISSLNYTLIICMFIFYFLSGYLFYGALFAAVGAAVDSETDTQQFMLPLTIPLVFAFIFAQSSVLNNPDGSLAVWLSMIPLTAPVVMMVRIPFFESFNLEIAMSMFCMIIGFMGTVWLAARIYRTGILMYGKKPTYREIGKWLFYKY